MPAPPRPADWDIFCTVVDNYGDIGVCWRLARQLAAEHDLAVRLWVDALPAFSRICSAVDAGLDAQQVDGVDIRAWRGDFADVQPAPVVVETFACELPERYVEAMAAQPKPPAWVNLEYLSAEAWTLGCHTLPSPHPRLPLVKYFFFPGFAEASGGLLREADLLARHAGFRASPPAQRDFWRSVGGAPRDGALAVSLFAYANAALAPLLSVWERSETPVCCFAPLARPLPEVDAWAGRALQPGDTVRRGAFELRALPFFEQRAYDTLLAACDLNLVRGEDSFVRAQWAGRPLLWQIYPQDEAAHLVKLAAFLELYCAGLTPRAAATVRSFHAAWNGDHPAIGASLWQDLLTALPELQRHAAAWREQLAAHEDLCSKLVRFCRSKL